MSTVQPAPAAIRAPGDGALRFNRACALAAFLWLATVLPLSQLLRPTWQDFSAFYMGGTIALRGEWAALYPDPAPGSPYYIGWEGTLKPRHQQLADERHVRDLCPYLQPPWNALLFAPLALLGFGAAHWLWTLLSTACACGIVWCAGRTAQLATARPSRLPGAVMLLLGFSPLLYRSVRVGNTSTLVGLCIGAAALQILTGDRYRTAAVMCLGGILKYATAALVPLLVVARRWRALATLAVAGGAIALLTLAVTGPGPFREFLSSVAPTMNGSTTNPGNQSIYGLLLRTTGHAPLPPTLLRAVQAVQAATFLLILVLMVRRPVTDWTRRPAIVFASSVALVAWLLIFGPLFWEHYHAYLCPFWGWLLWEARQSKPRLVLVAAAIAMAWMPLPVIPHLHLPEPLNSHMLCSAVLMAAVAIARLASGTAPDPE